MSKNIAISDAVYERLKREKGDRSFSEVIEDRLECGGNLSDVVGAGALDHEALPEAADEIERLSHGTLSRLDDEDL